MSRELCSSVEPEDLREERGRTGNITTGIH